MSPFHWASILLGSSNDSSGLNLPSTHLSSGSVKKNPGLYTQQLDSASILANYDSEHSHFKANKQENDSQRFISSKKIPVLPNLSMFSSQRNRVFRTWKMPQASSRKCLSEDSLLPLHSVPEIQFQTTHSVFARQVGGWGVRILQQGLLSWRFPKYPHARVFSSAKLPKSQD